MSSLRTRWRVVGRYAWRVGLLRGEWWIGARYNVAAEMWEIGVFGAVLIVCRNDRWRLR